MARILPSASYDVTWYSEDLDGGERTRQVPTGRVTLEGPRLYRVWDLAGREFIEYGMGLCSVTLRHA